MTKRFLALSLICLLMVASVFVAPQSSFAAEDVYAWVLVDTYVYPVTEHFKVTNFWAYFAENGTNYAQARITTVGGLDPGTVDKTDIPDLSAKYTWTSPPNIIQAGEKVSLRMTQEILSYKVARYGISFRPFFKADSADLEIWAGTSSKRDFTGVYPDGSPTENMILYPGHLQDGQMVGGGDPQFQKDTSVDLSVNFYDAMAVGTKRSLYVGLYVGAPGSVGTRYTYEYKKVDPKLLINNNAATPFESGVRISWNMAPGIGYRLYRSESPNELGISVTDFLITSTSYADVNMTPGKTYTYTVKPVLSEANPLQGISEKLGEPIATFTVKAGGEVYKPGQFKNFIILQLENPYLSLNGESQEIDPGRGTEPIIISGRTMVPIRAVVEAMGGTVGWEGSTQKITLNARGNTVEMWLGKTDIIINGVRGNMDVAPASRNGRTFVPVRFAAENLNTKVDWINSTKEAIIVFEE